MQLEDYFDLLSPDDIRIKGHRIGIESILDEYIYRERTPEQIARQFPTLTLEQVYGAITFYLHNRTEIDAYLERADKEYAQFRKGVREEFPRIHRRLNIIVQDARALRR